MPLRPAAPETATARPRRIAVLGAPGTGAETLVDALRTHPALPQDLQQAAILLAGPFAGSGATAARQVLNVSGCAQAWLMGLDDLPPDNRATAERHDAALRALLQTMGWPYQVFYGPAPARLRQALRLLGVAEEPSDHRYAIKNIANNSMDPATPGTFQSHSTQAPVWECGKCSDPECEHRLFQRLLARPGE
ncbi:hypothetical protein [Acidovorax sp. NCPPB 4044]|uniref:hypothetical protein n=1 Tax=Acidovorax sp. NCPPB 4044 TaxID=2940490 RepID=UPI002302F470|nr:hypothetical protein [Acidovorax sp. NCPPB 4044]MDA8519836.1 hypothetical protein [Acidovorax sp. NCPPB 4044]